MEHLRPRQLPAKASTVLHSMQTPTQLLTYLILVHDAACQITEKFHLSFPGISIDCDAVHFGAAIHDAGKAIHPNELTGPGNRHEIDGPELLERHGIPCDLARFARTHGAWSHEDLPLEDLLVALADAVWKGQRIDDLEMKVVSKIAGQIE